jgi:hypothetical protein
MGKNVRGLAAAKRAIKDHEKSIQRLQTAERNLRKHLDHLKYRNGGMVEQVGLHELPQEVILGALLLVTDNIKKPEFLAACERRGRRAMHEQAEKKRAAQEPPKVFVAFPEAPPESLLKRLKKIGLEFNRRNMEWRGPADYTVMQRIVTEAGWDQFVLRSGYVSRNSDP